MQIENLNAQQVEMLNKIWSIDTQDELWQFRSTLPRFRQQELDTLVELCIQEVKEQDIDLMDRYPEAEEMLERLKKDYLWGWQSYKGLLY